MQVQFEKLKTGSRSGEGSRDETPRIRAELRRIVSFW
jgi:hypothetical protein